MDEDPKQVDELLNGFEEMIAAYERGEDVLYDGEDELDVGELALGFDAEELRAELWPDDEPSITLEEIDECT